MPDNSDIQLLLLESKNILEGRYNGSKEKLDYEELTRLIQIARQLRGETSGSDSFQDIIGRVVVAIENNKWEDLTDELLAEAKAH